MNPQWLKSRNVIERVYIAGMLTLTTPAHFGNGDTDSLADIPLLRDSVDPTRPLLTGASIAGALRNYLREWQLGYGRAEQQNGQTWAEKLFGHLDESNEATVESWLMVDDALGLPPEKGAPVEIRDGVTIDPKTRTAEDRKKYDIELLAAGTRFPLHFELWLTEEQQNAGLLDALVLALKGFEATESDDSGEIRLGMRKRRGFGRCRVAGWQVKRFEMTSPVKIIDWLNYDFPSEQELPAYTDTLPESATSITDERTAFRIEATFRLKSSLLIRSDSGQPDAVDMVHLRSWRNGHQKPILSGTSLAGALRGRALRIAKTIKKGDETKAQNLIDGLFGRRITSADDDPSGSRLIVTETEIDGIDNLVQNRVKLNRFTGGAFPQALFSQQPLFAHQAKPTQIKLSLALRQTPDANFEAEVGLLLLLLKDLWTGDLPLGGESSVGRGVLHGERATLSLGDKQCEIRGDEQGGLTFDGNMTIAELEKTYLEALKGV